MFILRSLPVQYPLEIVHHGQQNINMNSEDENLRRMHLLQLLVTANVVPGSLILPTLMMEAICSSKTSVLRRATWRHIAEDGILHSDGHKNLKYYTGIQDLFCHAQLKFGKSNGIYTAVSTGLSYINYLIPG
jgi:hypothetical protein